MIEKILEIIEPEEEDEEWPLDAHPNDDLVKSLSHTKMVNEVNHRELRAFNKAGVVDQLGITSSSTGCHSVSKRFRRSDFDNLGPGPVLYFKMLKYLGALFAMFTIITIPCLMIYGSGVAYEDHDIFIQKWLAGASLGNLDSGKEIVSSTAVAIPTRNLAGFLRVECQNDYKISNLMHFGLAYKNETFMGSDDFTRGTSMNKTIRTIDRCTYGSMNDMRNEQNLEL